MEERRVGMYDGVRGARKERRRGDKRKTWMAMAGGAAFVCNGDGACAASDSKAVRTQGKAWVLAAQCGRKRFFLAI